MGIFQPQRPLPPVTGDFPQKSGHEGGKGSDLLAITMPEVEGTGQAGRPHGDKNINEEMWLTGGHSGIWPND